MFFGFSEKRKKRRYNFSWLFIVYCSSSLLSESDTAQRSHSAPCGRLPSWLLVCFWVHVKIVISYRILYVQQWLRMDHTRGSGNWITVITERSMWTHFDGLRTKLLLKIFTTFWYVISKKVKSHVFWNLKKRKLRILELCYQYCTLHDVLTAEVSN